jgi:hypothetical protein
MNAETNFLLTELQEEISLQLTRAIADLAAELEIVDAALTYGIPS